MKTGHALSLYNKKRNFNFTSEPQARSKQKAHSNSHKFIIQKHDSRRPHFDLRLEMGGTLKSWAIPKGVSEIAGERRLAVQVEDHPLEYANFEGEIPKGQYGAGSVTIWDKGIYSHEKDTDLIRKPVKHHLRPMQPSGYLRLKPKDWILHPQVNGLRMVTEIHGQDVQLISRMGVSLTSRFQNIVKELSRLNLDATLDGEVVGAGAGAVYFVYDLLMYKGKSMKDKPLAQRLARLKKLAFKGRHVQTIDQFKKGDGGLQIAKNPKSSYSFGRSQDWKWLGPSSALATPLIKNRQKVFFPELKITKGMILEYYQSMAPVILPYLADRPQSLNRHPDGIHGQSFYQKDMKGFHPPYLKTCRIRSRTSGRTTEYALIQNIESLVYIINLGCIEINPWLSRVSNLDHPDFMLIDLDPDVNSFTDVVEVALQTKSVLDKISANSFCKTSGAAGVHIGVPLGAQYSYDSSVKLAKSICKQVQKKFPRLTSMERSPNRRRGLIYLDCLQNRRGQTVVAPYSLRPLEQAPVSMPLTWNELRKLRSPLKYTILNTKPDNRR